MSTSYSSSTNLNLGQVPQIEDPVLYRALLDIHNALELLLISSDGVNEEVIAYIAKLRNVVVVGADYVATAGDGILLVDASAGSVTITLHELTGYLGYRLTVKRVDANLNNTVTIVGDGAELIDGHSAGISVYPKSSYTMVAGATYWSII